MSTLTKNSQFSFRTNAELLEKAKIIVKYENLDMTTLFNNLLEKVVEQESVPALLLDNEKSQRERTIDELYSEIDKGYRSYLSGKGKSTEEVFAKYGI
ncbi:Antitoxin component of the RelBE or YafQ-DinJ toxin-antitoxin module [Streptococcus henryi]|uniref:Antitoxin component of the RelBE or YafQ-DinJ toxin-antitoxin module n=1 Tax=Streptococcus henryi TaxID=439219 RepID=A0A1G6D7Y5_9STRE|nr:addiction module antitoxin RelB [Streptococcus henryi]SDB41267.1 Antitoxin component of the RelBE or YafQ-DinJ toxin-antitoxin module [Streptococcus henryi]